MADRTSAEIFAMMFEFLVNATSDRTRCTATRRWRSSTSLGRVWTRGIRKTTTSCSMDRTATNEAPKGGGEAH